jgi:hypothetical protein
MPATQERSGRPNRSGRKRHGQILSAYQPTYWAVLPKRFCQWAVGKFRFWAAVALFTLVEPVLCAQDRSPFNEFLQFLVLIVSTFLYLVQIVGVATSEWDRIQAIRALGSFGTVTFSENESRISSVKMLKFFTAEGEFMLEGLMLTAGWILIKWHPGLAILRCFRVFRLLW